MDEEDDDVTATPDLLTSFKGEYSNSNCDNNNNTEDFATEEEPQPPPTEIMYRGEGKGIETSRLSAVPNANKSTTAKKRKRECRGEAGRLRKPHHAIATPGVVAAQRRQ